MSVPISQKIIKPADCILGFGIPTARAAFFADQQNPKKDFARRFDGIWNKYYFQIVKNLEKLLPIYEEAGLRVVHNMSLADFGAFFSDSKNKVIILFSHWHEDQVEFADGLVEIEAIVDKIPLNYEGIIDLCVCHPTQLSLAIREKRPYCLVRYIPREATPAFWLYFYVVLFRYLEQKDISYLQALEDVIKQFLSTKK